MRKAVIFALSVATITITSLANAEESSRAVLSSYKSLMEKIGERLIVISETAKGRDGKQMQGLVKTLEAVDKSLAQYTPDSMMKTAQQRTDSLVRLSMEGKTKGNLGSVRTNLAMYYGDTEGQYPKHPKELVPKYFQEIPKLELSDHPASDDVRIVTAAKGDKITPYIKDTGKWLYIHSPESIPLHGNFVIDCNHKDAKGKFWYEY